MADRRLLGALLTFILLFSACAANIDDEQLAIPNSPAVSAPAVAEAVEGQPAASTQATEAAESAEQQTDTTETVDVAAQTAASTDEASTETASTDAADTDAANTGVDETTVIADDTATADDATDDATDETAATETVTTTQSVVASGPGCLVGTWTLEGSWIPNNFLLPGTTVTTTGDPILAINADGTGSGDYNGLTMEIRDADGGLTTMTVTGGAEFTWSADETRVTTEFSSFTMSMSGTLTAEGFTIDLGQFDITQDDIPEVLPPGVYDCFEDVLRIAPGNGAVDSVDYVRITHGVTAG